MEVTQKSAVQPLHFHFAMKTQEKKKYPWTHFFELMKRRKLVLNMKYITSLI